MHVSEGEKLVVRGWKWDTERLRKDALRDHLDRDAAGEDEPDFSVSVFAVEMVAGESVEDVALRAERAFTSCRSARWIALLPETLLKQHGFSLRLSEPPADHYDVPVGLTEDELRVEDLASLFFTYPKVRVST